MKHFYFSLMEGVHLCNFLLVYLLFTLLTGAESYAQNFPSGFSRVPVTFGIEKPTALAFAPDGRIFVAEKLGNVRVIKNGNLLSTAFTSLNVNSSGERGLIGIALDPNFANNQYIYLHYTLPDASRNRISRFTANGDVAVPSSEVIILDLDPLSSASVHNGGAIHFGPDGKLYVAVGENSISRKAQDLNTYHGKILRINPDGSAPSDNPFSTGSDQKRRVWAYGLRNPFTFDIQPGTGKIFVNDVGQGAWEEINDATIGGRNFGWPTAEGNSSNSSFVNPVYTYPHGSGDGKGCAITGGVFFNPSTSNYPAEYQGRYFFVDYCNRWINMLDLSGEVIRFPFASGLDGNLASIDVGNDGNLYYLSRSKEALFKIIYTNVNAPVITNQPANITVPEGQSASFSVSASGTAPLSYQWQKNGTNISGTTASTFTISNVMLSDAGNYRVVVSNAKGSATSNAASLTITEFNAAPVPQIFTPAAGTLYQAGTTISFSGEATDDEDGTLPASAFTWEVAFHHDTHTHDGDVVTGAKSGSFEIPAIGETSDNVWYRLYLIVEDSEGLSDTTYRDIYPKKSTVNFATVPPGLTLRLDGQPLNTPATVVGVEGIERTLGVLSPQTTNGKTYEFDRWEHGGSVTQTIVTSVDDVTYTAVFNEVSKASDIIKNFYLVNAGTNLDIPMYSPIEDGEVIDISRLSDKLDIRVDADDSKFKSLGIKLTGPITRESYENYVPYSVFGDRNGVYLGTNFIPGKYTLTVTPYSEIRRGGTAGTPVMLNFEIVIASEVISLVLVEENLWTNWSTVSTTATLNAGTNTIQATAIGSSGANTDHVQVSEGNQNARIAQIPSPTMHYVTDWTNLEIYPNPTNNFLYVIKNKMAEKTEFQILDMSGKRITSSIPENNGGKLQLDVAHLKDGWYILMIKDEHQVVFKKFIIQHR